ncbi:speckle-type POZ protein A-like [Contarinia nasturtii]|uniref:speckle-type POZ protein A-like n=1 Tax=Contarinia nasturtii TaxID=265458 RepID=UPI0012D3F23C|nr:speckle-type POZ protein A-like [Contarinia nasturtii]
MAALEPISSDDSNSPTCAERVSKLEVLENFKNLFNSGQITDFEIRTSNGTIRTHRAILAAQSPFFAAMFSNENYVEVNQNFITIDNYNPNVTEAMISYMYSAKLSGISEFALELMKAANQFQIGALKSACEKRCIKAMNYNNVTEFLIQADTHKAERLKQASMKFIKEHYDEVAQTEDWENFKGDNTKHGLYAELTDTWSPTKKRFRAGPSNE